MLTEQQVEEQSSQFFAWFKKEPFLYVDQAWEVWSNSKDFTDDDRINILEKTVEMWDSEEMSRTGEPKPSEEPRKSLEYF